MENFTGIELKSILLSDIEIMMPTFVLIVVKRHPVKTGLLIFSLPNQNSRLKEKEDLSYSSTKSHPFCNEISTKVVFTKVLCWEKD